MRIRIVLSMGLLILFVCGIAVTRSAAEAAKNAGEDLVIGGHDLRKTVNCNGNNIVVNANDSELTLKGQCNEVRVNGSTNKITIDVVASIVLESADNTVRWKKAAQGDKPKIVDRSTGNKIEQVK